MHSNTSSSHKIFIFGITLCYIVFVGNLLIFAALLFFPLPTFTTVHFFEQHLLNIFLFIIASGCLLSKYKNFRFFKVLCWYAGFVLLLSCLLFFIESVIYSNYITAYFNINEKTSPITTLCFTLIAFGLLDISLLKITKRIVFMSVLLIVFSLIGTVLNILHITYLTPMPIYSAINFILLAISFLFLYKKV